MKELSKFDAWMFGYHPLIIGEFNSVWDDTIVDVDTGESVGLISYRGTEKGGVIKWVKGIPDWITDEKLKELPATHWLDQEDNLHLIEK